MRFACVKVVASNEGFHLLQSKMTEVAFGHFSFSQLSLHLDSHGLFAFLVSSSALGSQDFMERVARLACLQHQRGFLFFHSHSPLLRAGIIGRCGQALPHLHCIPEPRFPQRKNGRAGNGRGFGRRRLHLSFAKAARLQH